MASRFWVGGTGTWDASDTTHWAATSGGAGGQSVPGPSDTVTFDASSGGGTVTLGYDPNVISITGGAFTGTLDFGTSNPTLQTFGFSGTGTRTLTMTNMGTMTLTGNAATIWDTSTTTNLTFNRGGIVNCTYSGGAGIRTVIPATSMPMNNLRVSAGNDVFSLAGGCNDLDFTGFTGTLSNPSANLSISGSLTFGSGMTVSSGTGVVSLTATTTGKTITMNGVAFNRPITFNGVGGGWTLQDNLNMSGASLRALTLTSGSFDANNFNVTCGSFASSNSNVRTLTMGSGTWTMLGTGTVFTTNTGTNLTMDAGTSTLVINDGSSVTKSVTQGSQILYTVTVMGGGGGATTFGSNFRATNFNCNPTGPTILQFANTSNAITLTGTWNVNGASGNPVVIRSSSAGSAFTFTKASGTITSYYLTLQDSTATGGATFNAIASINVSGNTGWNFIYTRGRTMNRVAIRNIPYSLVLDGSTGYIEYGNHAAYALGTAGGMSIRFKLAPQQVDTSAANSRFLGTLSDGTLNNFITFIVQNTSPYALVADVRSGGVSNTTTSNVSGLMDGRWYDAAIGWDANGTKIWLLGAVVGVNGAPATSSLGATPNLVSGRLNSGINGRYLTGNLQGLRLFSSKPTDEQIADLHLKGITPSNQVAYWPDDEGSGTSLAVVGSGNAGTLMGGVSWSSTDTPQKSRTAMSNRVACSSRVTTY